MITTHDLSRVFVPRVSRRRQQPSVQPVAAVDNLNLTVRKGEIVGLLGPNGAGKTSTLRMLTTLLTPSSGTATVAGFDVRRDTVEVRRRIGYVSQTGSMPRLTPAGIAITDRAGLYGVERGEARRRARALMAEMDLADLWRRPAVAMSGGQRRRLDIVMGLIHLPSVLFLDEPSTGLDPRSRSVLWEQIRRLRATTGMTVLLTTHYMEEADALCDRVLIMNRGQLVADDSPLALKERVGGTNITVSLESGGDGVLAVSQLESVAVGTVTCVEDRVSASLPTDAAIPAVVNRLVTTIPVRDLTITRPTLDDVFLSLTGRSLSGTD